MQAFLAPVEFMSTPEYRQLERAGHAGRWWRLVELAKRAGWKGCAVRSFGAIKALTAEWMAAYAEGDKDAWIDFLDLASTLGLVEIEPTTKAYQVTDWSSFHKPPAHETEGERTRKAEQRAAKMSQVVPNVPSCPKTPQMSQVSQDVPRVPIDRIGSDLDQIILPLTPSGGTDDDGDDRSASPGGGVAYAPPRTTGDDSGGTPPEPPLTAAPSFSTWWISRFCELRPTLQTLDHREKRPIAHKLAEAAHAGAPEPVLRWAINATISQVAHQMREETVGNPIRYADSLLAQHLENAMTQHRLNLARAETSPAWAAVEYTWTPDDS